MSEAVKHFTEEKVKGVHSVDGYLLSRLYIASEDEGTVI